MSLLAGLATSFGGKALLSGLSSLTNWLTGGSSITSQMNAQKHLMDHQFQLNQQQWAAENEYNSPLSQMTRLKSAGLNPNLVYGSGAVTGNTTTQGPRASIPHVDRNQLKFENLANIIDRIENIKAIRSNSSAQDALAELYGQQAANASIQGELMQMEKTKRGFENMLLEQTMPYSIEYSKLRNQEIMRNMDFTLKRMGLTDAQIDQVKAGIFKLNAETENIKERTTTQRHQNEYWWQYGQNPSGSIAKAIFDYITANYKNNPSTNPKDIAPDKLKPFIPDIRTNSDGSSTWPAGDVFLEKLGHYLYKYNIFGFRDRYNNYSR